MFNIGPLEFVVLAAVALIVFGPDRLPELAKDAARMLRALREVAQGARSQLNSELGPEFADFDLSSLNPRTAIKNALLGDDDFGSLNPTESIQRALRGEDDPVRPPPVDLSKPAATPPLAPGERPPIDPEAT
ncbi:MAG: sec-independent protein translocase protein TatB [Pseudonocardiales bacterium]|nr:sec-independent protein translocase protein TatB [Pseudonocardiales bacterium]